jgi:alkyldihydroxyacetonephosphate synthase
VSDGQPRRDTKWWGWGRRGAGGAGLGEGAEALLGELFGPLRSVPVPGLSDVRLPSPQPLPEAIAATVGAEHVFSGEEDRLRHAAGQGYADLVRKRSGRLEAAPDAVVLPGDAAEVRRLLEVCAEHGVAVVPYGGGTSVVGGVDPVRGDFERLISLDLSRLRDAEIDRHAMTARLGAGLRGPEAEAALATKGVTLGHFPQSFEYATVGGFAATRSAGQASSGYGRFDELVTAIHLLAPAGELRTLETPHSAAGPALRELIVGSEGVLGVIPEVRVRVRPAPAHRHYEAWMAPGFLDGAEIARTLAQGDRGALPDVLRVSDEAETQVNLGFAGSAGRARRAFDAYLRLRRRQNGALVIAGYEGTRESIARRRALAARLLRRGGAVALGSAPGRAWRRGRYHGPYLRDELLDHGILVETLETSHTWSDYRELYRAVGEAIATELREQGTPGLVMCHLSHVYPDGGSLYYTFMARQREGAEIEQWAAVKRAACEAIVEHGGTITHHHAVGRDHAPYMRAEVGELGVEALRALKERFDPAGVMNPGKMLPPD